MRNVVLKDGMEAVIREAAKSDAQAMIDFYNFVGGETDFLSFGRNEFDRKPEAYAAYLEAVSGESNSIILLALIDGQIVGIASINSHARSRTRHVGVLGIVVQQQYAGRGLGRILMDLLIEWAKSNGVTKKISLVTNEENTKAIELYRKVGFEVEGVLKKENYINGVYYNTIMMGLLL